MPKQDATHIAFFKKYLISCYCYITNISTYSRQITAFSNFNKVFFLQIAPCRTNRKFILAEWTSLSSCINIIKLVEYLVNNRQDILKYILIMHNLSHATWYFLSIFHYKFRSLLIYSPMKKKLSIRSINIVKLCPNIRCEISNFGHWSGIVEI